MPKREHGPQMSRRPSQRTLRDRHSAQVLADFLDSLCGCIPIAVGGDAHRVPIAILSCA
jgi:hypothetical protein